MDTGLHYLTGAKSRASFRCVEFHERPGHSDQLHVDLWWNGRLLVFDPGSYLYNGPPPWQDGLAGAVVHNAPVIDGQGPMQRAGRFLWAGRAQGRFEGRTQEYGIRELRGVHYGYRRLGLTVSRSVSAFDDRAWMVTDRVMPQSRTTGRELTRRLTVGWNLPDLAWEWLPEELHLAGDGSGPWLGWDGCFHSAVRAGLARAGDWIAGEPVDGPVALWGWTSPRYSAIEPCLRLVLEVSGRPPLCLRTRLSPTGEWPHRLLQVWDDAYLYGL
jgi:asparagine synthase (glutamine-hydrolysing)